MRLQTKTTIDLLGNHVKLSISGMAENCVGCLLVFATEEAAEKYAGPGSAVRIQAKENSND